MDSEKTNGRTYKEAAPPPLALRELPPPKRHGRWWPWLLIIAFIGGGAYLFIRHRQAQSASAAPTDSAARPVPVVAAHSRKADMNLYLTGLGTVTPANVVTLRTRVDGELQKVAFTEGQDVKQGDLLAQIDPRPFEVQLALAQGQLAKDQSALANSKLDLDRYKYLLTQKSVTQQQLDTQNAMVTQNEAALRIDQSAIDNANLQLTYSRITSPLTGRIGLRLVDEGNIVHASDATGLAVITQLQPIAMIFTLPEDDIPQIQKAMAASPHPVVSAYDRDLTNRLADGTLETIDNQIDTTTGKLRLKAMFPNKDNSLFANQFVNARLLVESEPGAIVVPTAAVQLSPQTTFVYVVKADNTVEMRNVVAKALEADEYLEEVSKGRANLTIIESGLSPGESVVTDGVDKLKAGAAVMVRAAEGKPTTAPGGASTRPHKTHGATGGA